ncbi:hypothetical protein Ahy_A07g036255 isoform E [Arachis hypogaea]|uniref:Transposase MuDR plant domain-containing protein n=1 Tax=Arachis hypogaea TaxID=3818 RepID=A0A445CFN2_ARAHY|nr:hypothetical protein Ahy_A07g036255 isoform E [Arachis hypogaea]
MASEDTFLVLVHHRGSIKRKTRSGVKFTNKDPLCIMVRPTTTYDALVSSVLEKLSLEATVAGSSSRPAVASSSVPVYEPPMQPVASPSFAVDLSGNVGDEVRYGEHLPIEVHCPTPAGVGEGLFDDPDDDDVEPDMIADDSGDDLGTTNPRRATARFGARDTEGSAGMTEFQVGQQFQDKDEALLSVKTYSIRRGVQYKVVESDYRRYVGKCSEFGNGCTWLIRLSLRQRKGIWDYHVIATFIMPMVRADAAVNIKVLQNATAAHFGFRPTYRRVWMAKQKAVAVIYGDWDESYNELPRWVLGVQLTMPGTVAVLKTCPVRVGA